MGIQILPYSVRRISSQLVEIAGRRQLATVVNRNAPASSRQKPQRDGPRCDEKTEKVGSDEKLGRSRGHEQVLVPYKRIRALRVLGAQRTGSITTTLITRKKLNR